MLRFALLGTAFNCPASGGAEALPMFRLYEWNFSSTIELVTGVLLIVTILAVSFA